MESILLVVAYASFVLAACSLIASIVIFVKADVPDAIRFLQHKPLKNQASSKAAAKKRKSKERAATASKPAKALAKRPTRSTEEVVEKAAAVHEEAPAAEVPAQAKPKGTTGTTVIDGVLLDEPTEHPTTILQDEPTERPTSLLDDDAERPTSLLDDDTERPTSLLDDDTERPTSVLDEDAERPTTILHEEETERPTTVLDADDASDGSIITRKEGAPDLSSMFKFQITKKVLAIHTDERI